MTQVSRRPGFTLVELLVSICIIGLLIGMLLPAVMYAQSAMRISQCKSNLHQIGLALQTYVDRQGVMGIFPDVAILPTLTPTRPTIVQVLGPFIETNQLAFKCPADTVYFPDQGQSYEYAEARLAGKTRPQVVANSSGSDVYSSSELMLMYDYENFHGVWVAGSRLTDGDETTYFRGSRNFLYLDGHVDNF